MVDYQDPKDEETLIFGKPADPEEETQVMKPRRGVYRGIKYLKRVVEDLVKKTNLGILLKGEYSGKPLTFGKKFYVFLSYKNQSGEQINLLNHPILYEVTRSDDDPKKPQYRPVSERERIYGNRELHLFIEDPTLDGKQRRNIEITVEIREDFGTLETKVMERPATEQTRPQTTETQRIIPESKDNFGDLKKGVHESTVTDLQEMVKKQRRIRQKRDSITRKFTLEPQEEKTPAINKNVLKGRRRFEEDL